MTKRTRVVTEVRRNPKRKCNEKIEIESVPEFCESREVVLGLPELLCKILDFSKNPNWMLVCGYWFYDIYINMYKRCFLCGIPYRNDMKHEHREGQCTKDPFLPLYHKINWNVFHVGRSTALLLDDNREYAKRRIQKKSPHSHTLHLLYTGEPKDAAKHIFAQHEALSYDPDFVISDIIKFLVKDRKGNHTKKTGSVTIANLIGREMVISNKFQLNRDFIKTKGNLQLSGIVHTPFVEPKLNIHLIDGNDTSIEKYMTLLNFDRAYQYIKKHYVWWRRK